MVLQVSRFPWGEDPRDWLTDMARAADEAGFAGLAVMDHLIQIPQVGRAWEPMPDPWVTLGAVAALGTGLDLGTLCTPVTFRPAGVTAKAAATLSALTGGRAFVGIGAGWWEREHAAYGLPFPAARERLDELERAIVTMRALWAPGTKAYDGEGVSLPGDHLLPAAGGPDPGGRGRVGGTTDAADRRPAGRRLQPADAGPGRCSGTRSTCCAGHCAAVGRDPAEVAVTVLDLPVVGRDRDDVWNRVERHRGRTAAAAYAASTHAGTVTDHRDRYAGLADLGVSTVFLATRDLDRPEDVLDLAGLNA